MRPCSFPPVRKWRNILLAFARSLWRKALDTSERYTLGLTGCINYGFFFSVNPKLLLMTFNAGFIEDSAVEKAEAQAQTLKETGLEGKDLKVYDEFSFKMQYAIRGQVKKIWYGLAELVTGEKAKDNDKTKGNAKNIRVSGENHNAAWWLPLNDAIRVSGYVEADALLKKADKFIQDKTKVEGAPSS